MGSDLGLGGKRYTFAWASHLSALVIGGILVSILLPQGANAPLLYARGSDSCEISFGKYKGKEYTTGDTVGRPKCLVQSKFIKVQQHQVRMPSGSDNVIPDWLWIDYHDRINVLVQAPSEGGNRGMEFYVFDQSKYALDGQQSMAIVGGIIEPNEQAEDAARREVLEEMKVKCKKFKKLGRFRTDVNRGMGWTNSFVALDCEPGEENQHGIDAKDEVGVPDTEKQKLRRISLAKLRDAAAKGEFMEIQWTATVTTALLQPELRM